MGEPIEERKFIKPKEYIKMEESAEIRSEYYRGEIFAMAGATVNHNRISRNILREFENQFEQSDSDCEAFGSDLMIEAVKDEHYAYPDVSVVCGEPQFSEMENREQRTLTNPAVIVEVLSSSTKDYDKGTKFASYRNIKSLRDYILIDQYRYQIEHFFVNEKGNWELLEYKDLNDSLKIESVNCELSLEMIYRRVALQKELRGHP
jgi:Uma2 family endonuclease